mgnify:CR=1 FL=1
MSKALPLWKRLWPLSQVRQWRDGQIETFYRRQGFLPIDETKDQDIFICGFPKSGNTWVQNLIASLVFGLEPRYLSDRIVQEFVPDVHQSSFYKRFLDTAFFKTHYPFRARYRRIVHLVRDPRDVAASFFHFEQTRGKPVTLEQTIERVIEKWRAHTQSYLKLNGQMPVMLLRYEDLLSQPENEVERLLELCQLERSEEIRARAIKGNDFTSIATREKTFGMANPRWSSEKTFFRKGRAGAYSETLNSDNVAAIESSLSDLMSFLGYEIAGKS